MTIAAPRIFSGFDQGHFTLPDRVLEARTAAQFLRKIVSEFPTDFTADVNLEERLVREAKEAAANKSLPDFGPLFEAIQQRPVEEARRRVLQRASREAAECIYDAVRNAAEEIVTGHLRPALEQLMAKAANFETKLRDVRLEVTDASMLTASKAQQDAWVELKTLAERYVEIRAGRQTLKDIGYKPGIDGDDGGLFEEFENFDDLWPQYGGWTAATQKAPWPSERTNRLIWIVRSEARPWMPTVAEQNEAYAAYVPRNKERVNRQLGGGHRNVGTLGYA